LQPFAVLVLLVLGTFGFPAGAVGENPCGVPPEPGASYTCWSTSAPCRGAAAGAYWRAGNVTAYDHRCLGAQAQHDGAVCLGEGQVYRANATRFGHHCRGVLVPADPTPDRLACAGDSWGEGPRPNATGRTCQRPIPPFDPVEFIYDLLGLVSYSDFAAFPRPLLPNPHV